MKAIWFLILLIPAVIGTSVGLSDASSSNDLTEPRVLFPSNPEICPPVESSRKRNFHVALSSSFSEKHLFLELSPPGTRSPVESSRKKKLNLFPSSSFSENGCILKLSPPGPRSPVESSRKILNLGPSSWLSEKDCTLKLGPTLIAEKFDSLPSHDISPPDFYRHPVDGSPVQTDEANQSFAEFVKIRLEQLKSNLVKESLEYIKSISKKYIDRDAISLPISQTEFYSALLKQALAAVDGMSMGNSKGIAHLKFVGPKTFVGPGAVWHHLDDSESLSAISLDFFSRQTNAFPMKNTEDEFKDFVGVVVGELSSHLCTVPSMEMVFKQCKNSEAILLKLRVKLTAARSEYRTQCGRLGYPKDCSANTQHEQTLFKAVASHIKESLLELSLNSEAREEILQKLVKKFSTYDLQDHDSCPFSSLKTTLIDHTQPLLVDPYSQQISSFLAGAIFGLLLTNCFTSSAERDANNFVLAALKRAGVIIDQATAPESFEIIPKWFKAIEQLLQRDHAPQISNEQADLDVYFSVCEEAARANVAIPFMVTAEQSEGLKLKLKKYREKYEIKLNKYFVKSKKSS